MAKLSAREMDAVVETVIKQIEEANANSPEQLAYQEQLKFTQELDKECEKASKKAVQSLMEEYKLKYPNLEFEIYDYHNRLDVVKPESPKNNVSKRDIERELLIANISGNINETMTNIINKYTNK